MLDTAIAELQRSSPDSPALIECLEQKSDLELTRQDVPMAIATAQASLAQAQRLFPRAPLHWISPRVQLGTSLRAEGRFQAADDMHRGTLDLLKQLGRERTANAVLLYNSWGIVRADIGDIAGAAQLFQSALAIGQALWVGAAPDQWVSVTYGRRLVLLNRLDEAEQHFSERLAPIGRRRRCGDADRRAARPAVRESRAGRLRGCPRGARGSAGDSSRRICRPSTISG